MSIQTSFFCLIPPGKQGPSLPNEGEAHKRVSYHGQKGKTCWYYGFKLLRNGREAPKAEKSQQRIHEKATSTLRKQITQLSSDYETSKQLARQFNFDPHIPRELSHACLLQAVEQTEDPEIKKNVLPRLKNFINQGEIKTFDQYLEVQWAKDSIRIYKPYLSEFSELGKLEGDLTSQLAILHNTVILTIIQIYGCKSAIWNPDHGGDALMQQLKEKGPHLIQAKLGKEYYLNEPKQLSEAVEGRNVYGWPVGAPRNQNTETHFVVLVGAKREAGGKYYVYFLDPLDASEPEQPATQKIYKVSYERMRDVFHNIIGAPFALSVLHKLNYPYALHM